MTDRVRAAAFDRFRVTVFHSDRARNVAVVVAIVIRTRNASVLDSEFFGPLCGFLLGRVLLLRSRTCCRKRAYEHDSDYRDDEHEFHERESTTIEFAASHFLFPFRSLRAALRAIDSAVRRSFRFGWRETFSFGIWTFVFCSCMFYFRPPKIAASKPIRKMSAQNRSVNAIGAITMTAAIVQSVSTCHL